MDTVNFGDNRWKISYGKYEKMEKKAIDIVSAAVSKHVPYVVTTQKVLSDLEDNIIFIGTRETNNYIKDLILEDSIPKNGYLLKVMDNPYNKGKQIIIIAGIDDINTFYGAVEFSSDYIAFSKQRKDHQPYFRKLFLEKMPDYEISSSPDILNRGLWTWGHSIYDYKKYIDNMALLKLNQLIIWNDYAPVNARQVVDYAHENGIKIIWGYSWGWGEKINISEKEELDRWADLAVKKYEEDYYTLGGDGIYFQSFTETLSETKDGKLIGEAVSEWVNVIGSRILDKYPDLYIQFGLHATSVKNQLEYISKIDKRISIIWEDCGAFPYQYLPKHIENFEDTVDFTDKIIQLREDAEVGVVLKGQICLDWSNFEHQKGPFILGMNDKTVITKLMNEKKEIWHHIQSYWFKNGQLCQDIIRKLSIQTNKEAVIAALVEDGLFEENIWLPVALYAQLLWDVNTPYYDTLCLVSQRDNVILA